MNKKQLLFLFLISTISKTFSMGCVREAVRRGMSTSTKPYSGVPFVKLAMIDVTPFVQPDTTKGVLYNNWLYAATAALPDLFNYCKSREIETAMVADQDVPEEEVYEFIDQYDVVPDRLPHGEHIPEGTNRVARMAEILQINPEEAAAVAWEVKLLEEAYEAGSWGIAVSSQGKDTEYYKELLRRAHMNITTSYEAGPAMGIINDCLRMGELPEDFDYKA